MKLLQIRRILRLGYLNVKRNLFITFSTIFIMTITLFVVGCSIILNDVLSKAIESVREKVDITVYFVQEATEDQIFVFRDKLEELPEVIEVLYTSRETALEEYKLRHENDPQLLEGIRVLGENPLRARLSIRSDDVDQFESITKFLENEDRLSDNPTVVIDKIDFHQNKVVIERLTTITDFASFASGGAIILFVWISILVVLNTMRLAVYSLHDEIAVMRVIGAAKSYIQGPFFVSGVIYGAAATLFASILLYPLSVWINSINNTLFGSVLNSFGWMAFFHTFLWLLLLGVCLGGIASWISVNKYIK